MNEEISPQSLGARSFTGGLTLEKIKQFQYSVITAETGVNRILDVGKWSPDEHSQTRPVRAAHFLCGVPTFHEHVFH